jgi:hypothetical protein
MSEKRKKTKIVLTYEPSLEYEEPCMGRTVRQVLGARDICGSCPRRYLNFKETGRLTVAASTKADLGSKDPGPNTIDGVEVCFHPDRGAPLYGRPDPLEKDPIAEIDAIMEANLAKRITELADTPIFPGQDNFVL